MNSLYLVPTVHFLQCFFSSSSVCSFLYDRFGNDHFTRKQFFSAIESDSVYLNISFFLFRSFVSCSENEVAVLEQFPVSLLTVAATAHTIHAGIVISSFI